jgi:hypothetical protein
MSSEAYGRGVRDGKNNSVAGSPTKSFVREVFEGYNKKELKDISDWNQGYSHGRKQRK